MNRSRAAAVPIVLLALLCAACSSSGAGATPAPSAAPVGTPSGVLAKVSSTTAPTLLDRNCEDFATQVDAQAFYIEAGGPDQDLHGLDPDHNGNACDEQPPSSPSPISSATVATAPPGAFTAPTTPQPSPSEIHTTQGVVEGESGGSGSQSSCESDDETRCG